MLTERIRHWLNLEIILPTGGLRPPVSMSGAKSLQSSLFLCDPIAPQAPLSMGFFRQKYCSGLPCPPPGDLPDPGIKPLTAPALVGGFFITSTAWEALTTSVSGINSGILD